MYSLSLSLLLLSTPLAVLGQAGEPTPDWNRPNDKSLHGIDLNVYGCGDDCKSHVEMGIEADRSTVYGQIPFDANFYATSKSFSTKTSKPGDLLKTEPYLNASSAWVIPGGTTLYRIQYVSVGVDDKPVPATAFVALPFAKRADKKPFNIIGFAHGTIGTFYGCAPSSAFELYDYETWEPLWLAGYAVVATDYAGLGNNYTKHAYIATSLAANDVYYSVVAAKKAFGNLLSDKWASAGHSQGGGTVWGLVESDLITQKAPKQGNLDFVGGVAISPANAVLNIANSFVKQNKNATLCRLAAFLHASLSATFPSLAEDFLTTAMNKRVELGQKIGVCINAGALLGEDLCTKYGGKGVYEHFDTLGIHGPLQNLQDKYGAGTGKKAQAPLLVVQSYGDSSIPYDVTIDSWQTTCQAGGAFPVELSMIPALEHHQTPAATSFEWLQWLADRFEGKPRVKKCEMYSYEATDADDASNGKS